MRGVLGKALSGMAQVAVPAAFEKQKAQILAERDARLQSYDQQNAKTTRDYNTSERVAGQEFTASENDRQRTLTREENAADRQVRVDENTAQTADRAANLALDTRRVDAAVKAADQALADGALDLKGKQQIQELRTLAINANADEATRTKAIDDLGVLLGVADRNNAFESFTSYGDVDEMTQQQTRMTGILNRRTGAVQPATVRPQGTATQPATPDEVRSALRAGSITREKARELLQQFDQ